MAQVNPRLSFLWTPIFPGRPEVRAIYSENLKTLQSTQMEWMQNRDSHRNNLDFSDSLLPPRPRQTSHRRPFVCSLVHRKRDNWVQNAEARAEPTTSPVGWLKRNMNQMGGLPGWRSTYRKWGPPPNDGPPCFACGLKISSEFHHDETPKDRNLNANLGAPVQSGG